MRDLSDAGNDRLHVVLAEYLQALEAGRTTDREALLSRHPDLADELRSFLDDQQEFRRLAEPLAPLAMPGSAAITTAPEAATGGEPGLLRAFGDYELLSEIGRGGMGVVYQARQVSLRRLVAVKMILGQAQATAEQRERFRREAEAVAQLRHPCIVSIHEVGEVEGLPYFSMEFVEGGNLADHLGGTPQPPRAAASLIATLAEAMHHAHGRGVVHRDLKPANVLLSGASRERGRPEGATPVAHAPGSPLDAPKITDFGLAKQMDGRSAATASAAIVGTPSYVAPEQADGKGRPVGPQADVYALGAILYECLTGRPPFRGPTALETLLQVVADEPVPPSRLQPKVPRDLETICLHCLQKEPPRRYASAAALADDLRRFLAGEPITARPVGAVERGVKWARRKPAAALLAGVLTLLIVGVPAAAVGVVATVRGQRETAAAEARADAEARARGEAERLRDHLAKVLHEAQRALTISRVTQAHDLRRKDTRAALALLECCPAETCFWEWHYVKRVCVGGEMTLRHPNKENVVGVCFHPEGRRIASAGSQGTIHVWDLTTGTPVHTLEGPSISDVAGLRFSPDGRLLAVGGKSDHAVHVWDAQTGREVLLCKGHPDEVYCVCWSPDGQQLASACNSGEVRTWDATTGRERLVVKTEGIAHGVCFSPDGSHLAATDGDDVHVYDARTARRLLTLQGHPSTVHSVSYSPDGRSLATGCYGDVVKAWDAKSGKCLWTYTGHSSDVWSVSFSPDGRRVASASTDESVHVLDATTGQRLFSLTGHTDAVRNVSFSPDGQLLVTGSDDGTVKVWDVRDGAGPATLASDVKYVRAVHFSPDGQRLVGACSDSKVRTWDVRSRQEILSIPGEELATARFSPDGHRLATMGPGRTVRIHDAGSGSQLLLLEGHSGRATDTCFSPDGRLLASGSGVPRPPTPNNSTRYDEGEIILWDVATGRKERVIRFEGNLVCGVAFSPDGRQVAGGVLDGTVRVWDVQDGRERLTLEVRKLRLRHGASVNCVCFSPDGRFLAAGTFDYGVWIWDAKSGKELFALQGHAGSVEAVAFSPDSQRLASASFDGTVKLWDPHSGQEVITLQGNGGHLYDVAFSPDGWRLAAAGEQAYVWETDVGPPLIQIDAAWHRREARRHAEEGHWFAVAFHSSQVLVADPDDPVALLRRGWANAVQGKKAQAEADLTAYFKRFSLFPPLGARMGR